MNNKGFTLIELIATIVVLALVMSIATYSITNIIKKSKEENYNSLINNIKDGAEVYYQECKYANNSGIGCPLENGTYTVALGDLVKYGYIKGNDGDNRYAIVNPKDDKEIGACQIKVSYTDGAISVEAVSPTGSCPTSY